MAVIESITINPMGSISSKRCNRPSKSCNSKSSSSTFIWVFPQPDSPEISVIPLRLKPPLSNVSMDLT
uniref:CSON006493 protein n=1 Tax=Culicoides sonorensis TaxID=179676 RepID=A0A336MWL6_CULSO